MNLLILGGTAFLGRHLVDAALRLGHTITLFNRGKTNANLYPQIETLIGDRSTGDLQALKGRRWDAVIDTCGYVPRIVAESVALLAPNIQHYTFISTCSVYADMNEVGITEDSDTVTLDDPSVEDVSGETYGGLKYLCERAVKQVLPQQTLIIRPGLIVGPYDGSDRFTYWPHRVAQGEEILAPDHPNRLVQIIDARDLAEWTLRLVADQIKGIFNAVGPKSPLTIGNLLNTCLEEINVDAKLTWVDEAFLIENEVGPYVELPLWLPKAFEGLAQVSHTKALQHGLTFRPLATTIRDTYAWHRKKPDTATLKAGLTTEREETLLHLWRAANHP
ncbi:MAG: NAD-dependent epimerase/dehydratase family protein [Chloroflexota bacterium]